MLKFELQKILGRPSGKAALVVLAAAILLTTFFACNVRYVDQAGQTHTGPAAARQLRRSIPACARVLAVELLCSCRSFDVRTPYRPGAAGAAVYRVVRQYANEIGPDVRDTWTTPQIEGVAEAILSGEVLAAAESAVGALK